MFMIFKVVVQLCKIIKQSIASIDQIIRYS